jgi:acyl dehydratase
MDEPMLTFDRIRVGTVYPEVSYRFTAEQVANWTKSFEDDSALMDEGADSAGGQAKPGKVPTALTSLYVLDAVVRAYANRPKGNVHAKQEFVWYGPVRIGDVLATEVIAADKYIKRGRRYVVTETRTRNQDGRLIATGRMTSIFAK